MNIGAPVVISSLSCLLKISPGRNTEPGRQRDARGARGPARPRHAFSGAGVACWSVPNSRFGVTTTSTPWFAVWKTWSNVLSIVSVSR